MSRRRRKRSYGSGGLIPPTTPGGPWAIRLRARGRRQYRGGFPTRELAERVLAKLRADDASESFGLPVARAEGGTLGEYATGFLERRALTHRAHENDSYRWKNHLAATFGHLMPGDVDAGVMRAFIEAKLAEGLASGTVRIMVALLSSLYTDLIEDKLADANPAKGLPRKTMRLMKPSHDPSTTPFIEKLADVDRIFRDLPEPISIAYAIGAMAGLRTGEVFALKWRHVDLQARRIHVREQTGKGKGEVFAPLKDKDSRMVPILDGLLPILTAWKLKAGGEGDMLLVPPARPTSKRVKKSVPGKHLRATLAKLKLERDGLGWYEATRHTFASQWVMNGGSIEKLSKVLGHYSVVVTERYAHLRVDLFSDRDLGTIPLTLGAGVAPVVEIGQTLASATPGRARQRVGSTRKNRSGPGKPSS